MHANSSNCSLIDEDDFADRFHRIVHQHSSSTCLVVEQPLDGRSNLTYASVHDAACRVHGALRAWSVQSKQLVAIFMERSPNLLISVLACLLNRSPFLMIEPSLPVSQRAYILADAQPVLLITDQIITDDDLQLTVSARICSFSALSSNEEPVHDHVPHSSTDPMYIMYTSGSTGTPKGAVVSYRVMYNRFQWMWTTYPWMFDDVQLWKTSTMFGDCIWEMFGGLLAGVPTVVISTITARDPYLLLHIIKQTHVTRITLIPSLLSAMLKLLPTVSNESLRSLRHVIVSGEVLPKAVCKQLLSLSIDALLLNLYGSTEIGNDATYYEVRSLSAINDVVPIGQPISGMDYQIVDEELWITGNGLSDGYLNNPTLINEKFMIDNKDHRRYFRTGDRVCLCPQTGQLLFLGRISNTQVKVRGARVELEEIEAICMQHDDVSECGCFLYETKAQLIALVRTSKIDLYEADLRQWLSERLHEFQVPSIFVFVNETLPRTTSGKLDRRQLCTLFTEQKSPLLLHTNTNLDPIAQRVMKVWCHVLGIPEEFSSLTFTELGGHSLLAIQLQYELRHEFSIHIPIQQFFQRTTLADLIRLMKNSTPISISSSMHKQLDSCTTSLTLTQKSIWIADELYPSSSSAYNVICAFEILSNEIDTNQIKEAIRILIQRHAVLRTIFSRSTNGEILQVIEPLKANNLPMFDSNLLEKIHIENIDEIEQILTELTMIKFDFRQNRALCRFYECTSINQHLLVIVLHHLIVDGWSLRILGEDLDRILACHSLEPVGMQFYHYAQLEHEQTYEMDLIYWKNKLNNGDISITRLVHDHEESQARADRVQLIFPVDITELIRSTSKDHDVTPFMILLTTLNCLLARYTNSTEVSLGIQVANRTRTDTENTVGLFTNTLIARIDDLSKKLNFLELLRHVKQTVLEAFAHQSVPFVHLLSSLEYLQRDSHENGLFQIVFAYQNVDEEKSMHVLRKIRISDQVPRFEIDIQVWPEADTFLVEANFRADFFERRSIEQLLQCWLQLTRSALSHSTEPFTHWQMVSHDDQLSKIVVEGQHQNNHQNLCQIFNEQVKRTPNTIAMEDGVKKFTYEQVWHRTTHFACQLQQVLHGSTHQCIAIRMRRSADLIHTMWSILLSNNYYVYVDPTLPIERQHFILHDTDAKLLITDQSEFDELIPTLKFDVSKNASLIDFSIPNSTPNDLVYILYTSGSTGTPKGVCISHRAIAIRMINVDYHSICMSTRVTQMSSFSFDMSTFEVFATLLNGGTLVIVPQESICSARALHELHLDVITPSTAVFNTLVQQTTSHVLFQALKHIYFGGEKVNMKHLRQALNGQQQPISGKFIHAYGPTETTVFTLVHALSAELSSSALTIPIGRPLPHTSVYIVDQQKQLVPIGVPGELWIGGGGLSLGYHNRPDLTREKFIENPFGKGTIYRSGDLCRMRVDGTIEFLYRLDNQVKLRSQRLELGEIESQLIQHESITDAVVLLRNDIIEDEQHLVAYVKSLKHIDLAQIQNFLANRLPTYMIPTYIVIMDKLSMTHVGKVDKRSLPKPDKVTRSTSVVDVIRQICIEVFKRDEIDLNLSFFKLGGHSLSAMELIARVYERFGVQITIPILFRANTLLEFIQQIQSRLSSEDQKMSSNLDPSHSITSHRAPLTPTQRQFWFFWRMKPDSSYYNVPIALEITGLLNTTRVSRALHHLVNRYVLLRTIFRPEMDGTLWQEEMLKWSLMFIEENVESECQISERLQYYATQPFDLTTGYVYRFILLHLNNQRHVLLICFHHIVCDGQSSSRFMEELFHLYSSENIDLSISEPSFLDYATRLSKTSPIDDHLNNVVEYLREFQTLDFDIIKIADNEQEDITLTSYTASSMIETELAEKLRELATNEMCTLHTVLLTLFQSLLSIFCHNTSDIVLGSIMSIRSQSATSNLFGPLINTVPIRTKLPNQPKTNFVDLLRSVRASVLFAMEHQHVSFADVIQRLRMVNDNPSLYTYLPVCRVLFEMNPYKLFDRVQTYADGSCWISFNQPELLLPFTKSDLDLEVMDYGPGQPIRVTFNLNRAIFGAQVAKNMMDCYRCATEIVARDPQCLRVDLWQQMHLIRRALSPCVLSELFRQQVEMTPNHCAVIDGNQHWTYGELCQRAKAIARYLREIELESGHVVALWINRSAFLIAAIFGALMAGATYLYLDPELPEQRIRNLLQNAKVHIIIKESSFEASSFTDYQFVSENAMLCTSKVPLPTVQPSDYCYLIYTSGSTGEPKGVKIQHHAIARRIRLPVSITRTDIVAQLTSCSFDVYILEIYGALLNGATLVIFDKTLIFQPKRLAQELIRQSITHMYIPTPIFNLLAEYQPNVFSTMNCVLFAGDRANAKLIRQVLQTGQPPKNLINAYGPTEITCIATWYNIMEQTNHSINDYDSISIGQALDDTPLYIVNPITLELINDVQEDGELLIGGYGVCDGYLNNSQETEARFLPDRYGMTDSKVYRTGDRVQRDPNGNLHFLGRSDRQVKINGYRIELLEIEHVLQAYPTIVEASVVIRDDLMPNTQSIVAYIQPVQQSERDIRRYLMARLPSYMLPSMIIPVASMPFSINGGKRDIKHLPVPPIEDYSSCKSKVELAWNYVLCQQEISKRIFHSDDDFFACGGNSISIVQLHAKLESLFGINLDVMQLFERRTLAKHIEWLGSLQLTIGTTEVRLRSNVVRNRTAIIGMSARYGPLESLTSLWKALQQGQNCCTNISHKELLVENPSMAEIIRKNPNYVHAGCMMTNAQCFDYRFFETTKRDADITDPQHRILLEATYEALEDAGLVPESYTGTIGMFGAVYRNTYADYYNLLRANPYEIYDDVKTRMGITNFDSATVMRAEIGNMIDGAPTFISYKLGFNGPSMAIQTACSSSGTALHMALRSIEAGDCTIAIVAGVCINFPLGQGYNYQPGMIMSKSGVCRSFDEQADGVIGGDGAGVVVLMKVEEAEGNGYGIRAIITGHAINNDGKNKMSYSTTSPDRQADCMKQALAMAQLRQPLHDIDYIEAHGSGTPIGDLLEIQALTKAYSNDEDSRQIYSGSIKTNVGHTAHAATLAGLIKIVLSLNAGEIPATPNFHRFSPNISRLQPPFIVNNETISWPSTTDLGRPRRAALNALGQGGTNTHFIVEQGYAVSSTETSSTPRLFLFSAKTTEALMKIKQRFLDHLSTVNHCQLNNISFTLACGRINYEQRNFVIASSIDELKEKVTKLTFVHRNIESDKFRLIFVFPGQGSQYNGMARDLYHRFPHTCAPVIDRCLQQIRAYDVNIGSIVYACIFDQHVSLDQYAQLVLFIIEYTLASLFLAMNIRPDYLIGHSSGEFTVACIAGVMSIEDVLKLLVQRCQLMSNVASSAMLAVEIKSNMNDSIDLTTIYDVDLAVCNSSTQVIYAGTVDNIARMEKDLRQKGTRVKLLNTVAGFHSRFMEPIRQQMQSYFTNIELCEPTIPIISTVTGRLVKVGEMTKSSYWCDHLRKSVLFGPALESMQADGLIKNDSSTIFLSVGAGKGLLSLLVRAVCQATVISAPLLSNNITALDNAFGELWMKNIQMNWLPYFEDCPRQRVSLPTYPFERTLCVADNRATCSPPVDDHLNTNTSTDLFTLLDRQHISCVSSNQSKKKSSAPWKIIRENTMITIKSIDLRRNLIDVIRSTPTLLDQTPLALGAGSSLFVRALYYDALRNYLISSTQPVASLVPVEYRLPITGLTLEDLLQAKIDTDSQCSTINELLAALRDQCHITDRCSSPFPTALLGHILAAVHECSFEELVDDRIIRPLGLKHTQLDLSLTTEAFFPANGFRTSIEDLQTILTLSVDDHPIATAFHTALVNNKLQFSNVEQVLITIHPNDSTRVLILASNQIIQQNSYDAIINEMKHLSESIIQQPLIDYGKEIETCLEQLLGNSTMDTHIASDTSFQKLGIDSLQAITFVELLAQKFRIEIPLEIIADYPTISSLANRLKYLSSAPSDSSEVCHKYILNTQAGFPYVYEAYPADRSMSALLNFIGQHKNELLIELRQSGALLFRGFQVETADEFSHVVELLADTDKTFHDYRDGISPRTRITEKVFTSTEYPKQFDMALHNELSYSNIMPSLIFFFCQTPPTSGTGGETPIGDSAAVYQAIDPNIREEFSQKQLLYVTNMPSRTHGIIGKSWQDTYQTQSKVEVEQFLRERSIQFKWLPNDTLRTLRRAEAIRRHPITDVTTWCNHAHLFHPSDLNSNTRQALEKRLSPLEMPKNCFFGNGDPIPDTMLDHIRQVLKNHEVKWPWCEGDILVLDNVRIAHGRASFTDSQRRILVAMC